MSTLPNNNMSSEQQQLLEKTTTMEHALKKTTFRFFGADFIYIFRSVAHFCLCFLLF